MSEETTNNIQQMSASEAAGSSNVITNSEEYQKNASTVDQLIVEGKKLVLAELFGDAADKFEVAVKTATEYFGQFSHECFQPALNYGKTLVQIARLNLQIVDRPLDRIYEESDEDESGDDEQLDLGQILTKQNDEKDEEQTSGQQEEKLPEVKEVATEGNVEETEKNLVVETGEIKMDALGGGEEDADGDDPDDIQTAWEWLEVARKICEKQEQTPYWLQWKSEVFMELGECLTVADEFEQALGEFSNALEIRQKIFLSNDRRIAETHFFIALTDKNLGKFDKAAEQYELAKQVLEGAIDAKKKELTSVEQNLSQKLSEEIKDLESIIKSVKENIRDALDSAETNVQKTQQGGFLPETKILPSNPAEVMADGIEANDLSGLVKRKPIKRPLAEKPMENAEVKEGNDGKHIEEFNGNGIVGDASLQPDQKRVKINIDMVGNEETK